MEQNIYIQNLIKNKKELFIECWNLLPDDNVEDWWNGTLDSDEKLFDTHKKYTSLFSFICIPIKQIDNTIVLEIKKILLNHYANQRKDLCGEQIILKYLCLTSDYPDNDLSFYSYSSYFGANISDLKFIEESEHCDKDIYIQIEECDYENEDFQLQMFLLENPEIDDVVERLNIMIDKFKKNDKVIEYIKNKLNF